MAINGRKVLNVSIVDGKASVTVQGVGFSEDEFDAIIAEYNKLMEPTWEQRRKDRKAAERAELEAKLAQHLSEEDIGGQTFKVQRHFDYNNDVIEVWLACFGRSKVAPFIIARDGFSQQRQWAVLGPNKPARYNPEQLTRQTIGTARYGSYQKAAIAGWKWYLDQFRKRPFAEKLEKLTKA